MKKETPTGSLLFSKIKKSFKREKFRFEYLISTEKILQTKSTDGLKN